MIPGEYNYTIVRGTTSPLVVKFQSPVDPNAVPVVYEAIPFTDVHLTITKVNAKDTDTVLVRKKLSDVDARFFVSDAPTGEITWMPTPAESRALLRSKEGDEAKNYYEFELWNVNEQTVYLTGLITAIGGVNDDV
jgi:hypothetical protein